MGNHVDISDVRTRENDGREGPLNQLGNYTVTVTAEIESVTYDYTSSADDEIDALHKAVRIAEDVHPRLS